MTRVALMTAGLAMSCFALGALVTTVPEPERLRTELPPDVVVLRDASEMLERGGGDEDPLRWVNAFPSEVAGPTDELLRIETEAVPSPLSWGATLVRVTVQASRTATTMPPIAEAHITFFGSETTGWRPQTDFQWRAPGVPLRVQLTDLSPGATRSLFIEVDEALRWGGSLGVVTLEANGRTISAPIERSRPLDEASSDFRFATAVLLTMHPNQQRRAELEAVTRSLVADTAPGVPSREAFVERFVPDAPVDLESLRGPPPLDY